MRFIYLASIAFEDVYLTHFPNGFEAVYEIKQN